MKNVLAFALVFVFAFVLSSCNNVYRECVISDEAEYNDMWSLPERRANETSLLFPTEITDEKCMDFFCKHSTYYLVGAGWQTLLTVQYDAVSFLQETERLRKLCEGSPVCGKTEFFDLPSYASVWNWESCFEYAVTDETARTVTYIYLQLIEKTNVDIDERYLPQGYERVLPESPSYSVYGE